MKTFAVINLLLTVSHHQFGLGLVMMVLLRLVSTTSMKWNILCLTDFFASSCP